VTTLRTIAPQSDPTWADLMRGPQGSGFGAPPWLAAIADTYDFDISARVITDDDSGAVAGFTYAELDDFRGHRLISAPFCDYLDPVVDSQDQWRELVDPLIERELPLQLRVLNCRPPRQDQRFTQVNELAWHDTDLTKDEEQHFASLNRRARQNIRYSDRQGVEIRIGSDIDMVRKFHELHCSTRKRRHSLLAQPVSFFENIWAHFAPIDGIVIALAEYEGEVIAGSLNLVWGDVWYHKFSASNGDFLHLKPNEALAWRCMRVARERGLTSYDWGVSDLDQPGLIEYKRKFASDERIVTVLRHIPEGWADPHAAEAGRVLGELTEVLTRPDVPDDATQRAGEILYRYFT